MGPLFLLLFILAGVLGNLWILAGMPAMKAGLVNLVVLAASAVSTVYFVFGLPVWIAVLGKKYQESRAAATSLVVSIVMLTVFYLSAVITWLLVTRGWELSIVQTIRAAGDSATYGKLEDRAEHILIWLMVVPAFAATAAGLVSAPAWHFRHRFHRAGT